MNNSIYGSLIRTYSITKGGGCEPSCGRDSTFPPPQTGSFFYASRNQTTLMSRDEILQEMLVNPVWPRPPVRQTIPASTCCQPPRRLVEQHVCRYEAMPISNIHFALSKDDFTYNSFMPKIFFNSNAASTSALNCQLMASESCACSANSYRELKDFRASATRDLFNPHLEPVKNVVYLQETGYSINYSPSFFSSFTTGIISGFNQSGFFNVNFSSSNPSVASIIPGSFGQSGKVKINNPGSATISASLSMSAINQPNILYSQSLNVIDLRKNQFINFNQNQNYTI